MSSDALVPRIGLPWFFAEEEVEVEREEEEEESDLLWARYWSNRISASWRWRGLVKRWQEMTRR